MNHFKNSFLIFSLALTIGACSSHKSSEAANADETVDPELAERGRKLENELALGREMAARLAGTLGVHEMKESGLEVYLNTLAQALARKAGRPEINYRVAILDDEKPNAYAAPGGYLFVTKGLVELAQSEEELAGVLAHEIGHVNERHVMNKVLKNDDSVVGTLARTVGGGRSTVGASINQAALQGLKILMDTGYGPQLELEADRFSIELTAAAGYSPRPYFNLLERMSKLAPGKELSKTHPPFKERLDALKKFYAAEKLWNVQTPKAQLAVMSARFAQNKRLL